MITHDPLIEAGLALPGEAPGLRGEDLTRDHGLFLYREMLRIRRFEEKCYELYQAAKIRGFMHLYDGEEAVSVGIISVLRPDDPIVATYREHGQALARGVSMATCMAEMYGKQEGCARGRGGSMHLFDVEKQFYGGNAIVAGGLPIAVGIALADKMQGRPRVTACFFGDGAVQEGEFHECMNLAKIWDLPVLFVVENNQFAMGVALEIAECVPELVHKAEAYRMPAACVDGMDILAVEALAREATASIRAGNGPYFIEARTYRFRAHSMFDAEQYRTKDQVSKWRERDPLILLAGRMRERGLLADDDIAELEQAVAAEISEAVAFAEAGTPEDVEDLERFVYTEVAP
jgi:pyruvate dehydrogenase E1 component alpha subunit